MSAVDVADAHAKDLEVQDQYGVKFLTYWFDQARGTGFCLIDAPDKATALRVHGESHGEVATDIISVDLSAVEAFLGRISDPAGRTPDAAPNVDSAFRAVIFTDIVDSTAMTARLGDPDRSKWCAPMMQWSGGPSGMSTDVRSSTQETASWRPATTSFRLLCAAVPSRKRSRTSIATVWNSFRCEIGVHSGEPVQDGNDIFGAAVQMSARICAYAAPGTVVVSDAVREELPDSFNLKSLGSCRLQGICRCSRSL